MISFFALPMFAASALGRPAEGVTVFLIQIVLLVVVGRLLGEWMQRVGQPAVIGQLLAGIVLGPSLFGAIWPAAQQTIFPAAVSERQMLNGIAEFGVLLLLLITGMETDLALVKRVRRMAAVTSAAGIIIPFGCGYLMGELLPVSLLPDPHRRLLTSLFLAAALSISSVKIVAAVLREVDFLRRNLGQVILAAAILDDTIGWTILALISGLASRGRIIPGPVLFSVVATVAFLVFCFTIGSRLVASIIRWTNDHFVSEMPVISVILVIMILMALVTNSIGVHTVLGAFAGGVMIGQSPILTKHIEEELRGLIVALFMPVFFGVAGLSIDLKILTDPRLAGLAFLFITIASVGKLGGCYLGARGARLNHPEALAVGFAMNARGSTEVILATIGLTMGVLNQRLFTIIVLMAVVTTVCMPPLLRWALTRVPMREDERERIKAEAAEENDRMPKLERVLVGVDGSDNGRIASAIAGWLIGARHLTTSLVDFASAPHDDKTTSANYNTIINAAEEAVRRGKKFNKTNAPGKQDTESHPIETAVEEAKADERIPGRRLISVIPLKEPLDSTDEAAVQAILEEAKNGYGLLFLGLCVGAPPESSGDSSALDKLIREFSGPVAIFLNAPAAPGHPMTPLEKILVPTTGADYSRFGAEVAVAVAKGCGATITALHVSAPPSDNELLRHSNQLLRTGRVLLADIVDLGSREGVRVVSKALVSPAKENAIIRQAKIGRHQLIVIGIKTRAGDSLRFGGSAANIIDKSPCPVLIVKL